MSGTTPQPADQNRMLQVSLTLPQWNAQLTLLSLIPALVDVQMRQLQTQLTAQLQLDPQSAEPAPGFAVQRDPQAHPVANGADG